MKKQIVVIHGGSFYKTRKEFLADLKKEKVDINDFKTKSGWKESLDKKLGESFDVIFPRMPNKDNANYEEWRVWFEKLIPFLKKDVILIGHSLGGIFIAKYLSENKFPKKVLATILVAAPYFKKKKKTEYSAGFELPKNLKKLETQCGNVFIYHSKDDPIVPFSHAKKYKDDLPNARLVVFKNKKHIWQKEFPEIVTQIKKLK